MTLRVYNTLTKRKEDFVPRTPGKVGIYVCGVTPYNHPHIGNARPFVTWDVIRRYLEFLGYDVLYVQNFTDIDDKIINTAKQHGESWSAVADRYIAAYYDVMDKLHIRRASVYPRVSQHIADIIAMVEKLVRKGYAYELDGDVYFAVHKFPHYGCLSGRTLDEMQAGARVEVDERKTHPMDFALWKSAKPGEPAWDSPWGSGRPGWHIECSAMSLKYLGTGFDFHGGGSDLIFPHHENEIAQAEAATGQAPFVRYWLHNGFITVDQEKMSKSLGNFSLVKDILAHYEPETLRFFILSTHYRSPLDFSDAHLQEAARGLDRLRNGMDVLAELARLAAARRGATGDAGQALMAAAARARQAFFAAMDDDFNTALAIGALFELVREINIYRQAVAEGAAAEKEPVAAAQQVCRDFTAILGILAPQTVAAAEEEDLLASVLRIIIDVRQAARQRRDWETADSIRDRLNAVGIILEDTPQGVRWKRR